MSTQSRHLQVQNAIVARLATIKKPTYTNDIEIVTNRLLDLRTLERFPSVSVLRGPWDDAWDSEDKDLRVRTAAFGLVGFVRSLADDQFEGRLTDAADAFEADMVRAFNEHDVEFLDTADADSFLVAHAEPLLSDDEVKGVLQLVLSVEYRYKKTDDYIVTI